MDVELGEPGRCGGGRRGNRAGTGTAGGGGFGNSSESKETSSPYCFFTAFNNAAALSRKAVNHAIEPPLTGTYSSSVSDEFWGWTISV